MSSACTFEGACCWPWHKRPAAAICCHLLSPLGALPTGTCDPGAVAAASAAAFSFFLLLVSAFCLLRSLVSFLKAAADVGCSQVHMSVVTAALQ